MGNAIGMSLRLIIVVLIFHVQYNEQQSKSRYCQEAINSVKIVESCPSSKAEWDDAARRKDCSSIALKQNCSSVQQFQYHCVINEYRSELLEVCAPSRFIFGNCVEFNVAGGVIQDQSSAPCNETFPKCDDVYPSWNAYLYPDCYQFVFNGKITSTTTTTAELTYTYELNYWLYILSAIIWFFAVIVWIFVFLLYRTPLGRILLALVKKKHQNIERRKLMQICEEKYNICDPELPTRNISPAPSSIQSASSGSTIYEDASDAKSDGPNVLQPNSDQRKDASDNQSEELSTVQSDSDNICDPKLPTRNISPAPSSIQSASSGSTIYEDTFDARSDGPNVLQPNSDKRKEESDNQSEELSTVQSDSGDTQEEHQLEKGSHDMKEEKPLKFRV